MYKSEEMEVYVERCNIPMKQVFQDESLKKDIADLLLGESKPDIRALENSPQTFRQLVQLYDGGGIPPLLCSKIEELLAAADEKNSYTMMQIYPMFKQDAWELHLSAISYMKVEIRWGEEWSFTAAYLQKYTDQDDDNKSILLLIPFEDASFTGFETKNGRKQYRISFHDTKTELLFLKTLILNGTVDVKEYVEKKPKQDNR